VVPAMAGHAGLSLRTARGTLSSGRSLSPLRLADESSFDRDSELCALPARRARGLCVRWGFRNRRQTSVVSHLCDPNRAGSRTMQCRRQLPWAAGVLRRSGQGRAWKWRDATSGVHSLPPSRHVAPGFRVTRVLAAH